MLGNWVGPDLPNFHAMATAIGSVNETFHTDFTLDDANARRRFLQERYDTFSQLVDLPGVLWHEDDNTVHTQPRLWKYYMKVCAACILYLIM